MNEVKCFTFRLSKEDWYFLKQTCLDKDTTMNELLRDFVKKTKARQDKRLQKLQTMVP